MLRVIEQKRLRGWPLLFLYAMKLVIVTINGAHATIRAENAMIRRSFLLSIRLYHSHSISTVV
jgi:hypothetical protein